MRYLLFFLVLLGVSVAPAQEPAPASAKDYFNKGSEVFIRENPEPALAIVNEGLSFYPDDPALLKLKELLEQQNEQQNQQNQDEQNQDGQKNQENQDPADDSQEDQKQENQDEQNQDREDQKDKESSSRDEQQESPPEPEDITEEEANMVLDSLRQLEQAQREQLTKEMIRQQMSQMPPVEKDW